MTKEQAVQILVDWCNAQVGTREGSDNWNKYAEDSRLRQLYGWNAQNEPWCDLFTDEAFITCFGLQKAAAMTYQPIGAGSAACRFSAQFFKNNGAWYSRPQVGDVIFFYYGGEINHQGIVVAVENGEVRTVEGNSSDMVARRSYAMTSTLIAGYGRPKWDVLDGVEPTPPEDEPEAPPGAQAAPCSYCPYVYAVRVNLLKRGSYGPQVTHMQQLLYANGFDCGEVDGIFGAASEAALRAFQTAARIEVDGEWGGESFNALWNYDGRS